MDVDIKTIKVCALCRNWNDVTNKHVKPTFIPFHYSYDGNAREMCLFKRHETYGGQPGCPNYECKFQR